VQCVRQQGTMTGWLEVRPTILRFKLVGKFCILEGDSHCCRQMEHQSQPMLLLPAPCFMYLVPGVCSAGVCVRVLSAPVSSVSHRSCWTQPVRRPTRHDCQRHADGRWTCSGRSMTQSSGRTTRTCRCANKTVFGCAGGGDYIRHVAGSVSTLVFLSVLRSYNPDCSCGDYTVLGGGGGGSACGMLPEHMVVAFTVLRAFDSDL
jgi:hypothetical protein